MKTKYEISTKDKIEISYCAFILSCLLQLGFSPSNKGTYYLRDLILLAIQSDLIDQDLSLKLLIEQLATKINIPAKNIKSHLDYTFKTLNLKKAEKIFQTLFNLTYDPYFFTAKSLIILICNFLNRNISF